MLLKWKKGYVAPPHKHLSAAFAFILSGKLQVRDNVYNAGDFLHEVNGMVHGATTALEDTEYLFFCDGPVLFFDKDNFTGYRGWEAGAAHAAAGIGPASRRMIQQVDDFRAESAELHRLLAGLSDSDWSPRRRSSRPGRSTTSCAICTWATRWRSPRRPTMPRSPR